MKAKETQDFKSDHLKILLPTAEQKNFAVVITAILTAITRNTEGSAIFGQDRIGNSCSNSSRHYLEFHLIIHIFQKETQIEFREVEQENPRQCSRNLAKL